MNASSRSPRGRALYIALVAVLCAGSSLLVALAVPRAEVAAHPTQPIVDIRSGEFYPSVVIIAPGVAVRWVNRARTAHTVTGVDYPALRSPELGVGEEFEFTFNEPGTYRYVSSTQPTMSGEIRVVGSVYYAETGFNVRGPFLAFWQTHGLEFGDAGISFRESLALFGYPISGEFEEWLEDGNLYTVQYFERARFERHLESLHIDFGVQLGQFGRRLHPADPPADRLPGAAYFEQTGHNVSGRFLEYWSVNGGLSIFGLPLSEVIWETLEDGRTYQVQYFERARFEYHPNPPPYDVQLGQFGYLILEGGR